jgi:hypothetical protein
VTRRRSIAFEMMLTVLVLLAAQGCNGTLVFGTATKFGLDISQRPDQTVEVTMGYDRYELASIPSKGKDSKEDEADAYSVLGIFGVSYGNPWTEALVLRQFFATGWAARKAGADPRFQQYFGRKTGEIILRGEQEMKKRQGTTP